ncbi:MAG: tRNA adenosine(34) deaminase TadA [Polyangiaceae bacterium]
MLVPLADPARRRRDGRATARCREYSPKVAFVQGMSLLSPGVDFVSPLADEHWMRIALNEADLAATHGDIPVGCVVVGASGHELGRGRNRRELDGDPTAHAEVVALREAAKRTGNWRLVDATLYVTLEPCTMCAGAIINARIARVVYGVADPKAGAIDSVYRIGLDERLDHRIRVEGGFYRVACLERLRRFFATLRAEERTSSRRSPQ